MLRIFLTLGAGEATGRFLHVLAFLVLARALGKDGLGQFGFALTVTSYVLLIVQQGIDTVAMREIARGHEKLKTYAGNILGLRLTVATTLYLALIGYVAFTGLKPVENKLLLVLGLTYFTNALAPKWTFQALEEPKYLAKASIFSQCLFLAGALVVRDPSMIIWAAVAQLLGETFLAVYLWIAIRHKCGIVFPSAQLGFWKYLIRESWPMSASLLLGNLLYNFDVIALKAMASNSEIGLYLACYRCITLFAPIFGMLQVSIFPSLARVYPDSREIRRLAARVAWPTLLLSGVAAAVLNVWAGPILTLVYGPSFAEGAKILKVLAWTLPVQGVRSVVRQVLLASHLQRHDTANLGLAVVTNIVLDLVLIPYWGALGCAISTLISESMLWASTQTTVVRKLTKKAA